MVEEEGANPKNRQRVGSGHHPGPLQTRGQIPPGQQQRRLKRLQLKNGFGKFQVQTGSEERADPAFLGHTARTQ